MTSRAGHVPFATKIAYGVGAIAYGIKDNGFSVFLLAYYNQVVGLRPDAVGTVIAVALFFDAFIDPLIGLSSDRTYTRWGRRHPWLYGSALPIGLSWLMLWHPPQGSTEFTLGWLLVAAILTRASLALNEVPSLAMAPELTRDYHERTSVLRYRYLFGWLGGLAILMLAYGVFMAPPIGAFVGPKAPAGYSAYAWFGATVMVVTVLVSAIGTHRRMAHLPAQRIAAQTSAETRAQVRETLSNRAFIVLMITGMFSYTAQGVGFAISQYNLNYVWRLTTIELLIYAVALFGGMIAIFFVIVPIARRLGKARTAAMMTVLAALFICSTYSLRLLGLFPEAGTPWLLPSFLILNTIGTAFQIGGLIVGASMMSDVVEASQELTGRREEGLFFSGALFMQKTATGLGILITGFLLQLAAFPEKAVPGAVPTEVLDRYTLYFVIVTLVLSGAAALAALRFPFGEAEHNARLAKLAVAEGNSGAQKG